MVTRRRQKASRRSTRADGPHVDNAWEDFLARHRTSEPSTRRTRRRYCLVIKETLRRQGIAARPESLTAAHARRVLAVSSARGLNRQTLHNLRSTLNWIGRVIGRPLAG